MKVSDIVRDYNKVMKKYYTKGALNHANDEQIVLNPDYFDMWQAVAPYLSYAPEIWEDYDHEGFELDQPSMGAFAKCGMLKDMYKRIPSFEYRERRKKELFVIKNIKKAEEVRRLWHAKDQMQIVGQVEASQEIRFYDGKDGFENNGDLIPTESDRLNRINSLYEAIKHL